MKSISAFVGHSFAEEDKTVVDTFLRYFTTVARMLPSFSWDHAERAEPSIVDEKVQRIFRDKNLFIAICTRKEFVVNATKLPASIFGRKWYPTSLAGLTWKTSDWIIQEIGFAVGLDLPVIILLEDGVRSPGNLQGNLEYVTFERSNPEKAFPKILEMIAAVTPEEAIQLNPIEIETTGAIDQSDVHEAATEDGDPGEPSPDWDQEKFDSAFMRSIVMRDEDRANRISTAFLASPLGQEDNRPKIWFARCELVRLWFDQGGSLTKLIAMADKDKSVAEIGEILGRAFLHYQEFGKAAETFERAASAVEDSVYKLELLKNAAIAAQKSGAIEHSMHLLNKMRQKAMDRSSFQDVILRAERGLAESEYDEDIHIGALESLLENSPDDEEMRFELAYKYSQAENDELACFHYLRTPISHRSGVTWNNLGVSLGRLDMAGKSIAAYREAELLGETLAVSNIVNKLIDAGFLEEANRLCEVGVAVKGHHKNLDYSFNRLKGIAEDEEKKQTLVQDRAKHVRDFYREFGLATTREFPKDLSFAWQGPECSLEVTRDSDKILARGDYEQRTGLLALALSSRNGDNTNPPQVARSEVSFIMKVHGSALIGTVKRTRLGAPAISSTLLGRDDGLKVIMAVEENKKVIKVLEKVKTGKARLYDIKID